MENWLPTNAETGSTFGTAQVLYAALGPRLADEFAELVRHTDKVSDDLRNLSLDLRDHVGGAPGQLFYIAMALGRLRHWLDNNHGDVSNHDDYDEVLRRVGWDAYKLFGSAFMEMFRRFGFDEETLTLYMHNCVDQGANFAWPPPGIAYERSKGNSIGE